MANKEPKVVWIVRWLVVFPILAIVIYKAIDAIPLTYFVVGTAVTMIVGTFLILWILGRSEKKADRQT